MATYKIHLENHSGATQNYFILNAAPKLPDYVDLSQVGCIVSNNTPAVDTQAIDFNIHINYSAVVGYAYEVPAPGVPVKVRDPVSVDLGYKNGKGKSDQRDHSGDDR